MAQYLIDDFFLQFLAVQQIAKKLQTVVIPNADS